MRRRGQDKVFYLISVGLGLFYFLGVLLRSRALVFSEKNDEKGGGKSLLSSLNLFPSIWKIKDKFLVIKGLLC